MQYSESLQSNRVFIRGCGIISATGDSQQSLAMAMQQKHVAATHLSLPQAADHSIPYYSIPQTLFPHNNKRLYCLIDRVVQAAIDDAGLKDNERQTTAVFSGSTACDISDLEERYQQDLTTSINAIPLYRSGFGILSNYISKRFSLNGPEYSFNTACSSSANAFMVAADMIASGRFDNALILGVEVFNLLSVLGFNNMMLLSTDACKPFDQHRNGTVLGEAVAAVVLSKLKPNTSQYSGKDPFYYLSGANLCDVKNVTSASPEVIANVMINALQRAKLSRQSISFIKAHGTSTPNNDLSESQAMSMVYGKNIPHFTSLKSMLGHTLGACGIVEMVSILAALKEDLIPATANFSLTDPEIGISPITEHQAYSTGNVMLNYFGFGGNNTSLIISNQP